MGWTDFFIHYYYWMLLLNLVLIIGIGAFLIPYRRAKWSHIAIVFLIAAFSIYIRVPNLIVNDSTESLAMEYKVSSRVFFEERQYRMCYDGTIHDCNGPHYLPRHQHGHPFLASLSYYVLGVSEESMTIYNMAVSVLTVILVYIISFYIGRSRIAAASSALTLSLFHTYIWWATSSEVVVSNILFILLSLFAITISYEKNSFWHYLLAFFLILFSTNIRSENLALLLLLAYAIYRRNDTGTSRVRIPRAGYFFAAMGVVLLALNYFLVRFGSRQHGPKLTYLSPDYIYSNILLIGEIIFTFDILVIPFFGLFAILFFKRGRDKAMFFLVYLLIHVIMIASFRQATAHIDVRLGIGNLQRYAMPDFAIIILLGVTSFGLIARKISTISNRLSRRNWMVRHSYVICYFLLFLYIFSLYPYYKDAMMGVPAISYEESGYLYADIISDLDPRGVAVGSLEILQYHQFISDIPVRIYSTKDLGAVSYEVTGYYFIELVSSHFPEFEDNPYYHSKGAVPYMISGNFYIYNIKGYQSI